MERLEAKAYFNKKKLSSRAKVLESPSLLGELQHQLCSALYIHTLGSYHFYHQKPVLFLIFSQLMISLTLADFIICHKYTKDLEFEIFNPLLTFSFTVNYAKKWAASTQWQV